MSVPDPKKRFENEGREEVAYRLAVACHDYWILDMKRRGWQPGLVTQPKKKIHAWLFAWGTLPMKVMEDYMEKARGMVWIIDHAGLVPVLKAEEVLRLAIGARKNQKEKHK